MVISRNYLMLLAAFAVGVIGAIGFSVHAQSAAAPASSTPAASAAVQASDGDGEQADDTSAVAQDAKDQNGADLETKDDGKAAAADTQETESASDVGEVEDGK